MNTSQLSLNYGGKVIELPRGAIMGIVNATPDSFYAGSRAPGEAAGMRAAELVRQGADIIDVGAYSTRPGAYSTRPGAAEVSAGEEYDRLARALESIRRECGGELPLSIDTFRAEVARRCLDAFGPLMINDIGGTTLDPEIGQVAIQYSVPYVLMHMRGTPASMQTMTDYDDVVADVIEDLARKADVLTQAGLVDIIIDPGYGFAKTVEQNYALLEALPQFKAMGFPVLVGISRKTMIWKPLGITPDEALNGTTVLNTVSLLLGADILRVHDVKEAVQVRRILSLFPNLNNQYPQPC